MRITTVAAGLTGLFAVAPAFSLGGPIEPERLYAAPGAPVPVLVDLSAAGADVTDSIIELRSLLTSEPLAIAPVVAGPADAGMLFPKLWTELERGGVLFAQLTARGRPVGPALVLQPLTRPKVARFDPAAGRVRFTGGGGGISGMRMYVDRDAVLETTAGEIRIRLRPDLAPNTSWNFRELVSGGFYDGTPFHRVVNTPSSRFVIQGGDPTGTGAGGPGYQIDLEPSALPHDFGVVSMARGSEPDTAGSQFFIGLSRDATRPLDGQYASFGQVVSGVEAIQAIAGVATENEKPVGEQPKVVRARLVDAPPLSERPAPSSAPTSVGQPR